MLCLQWQYENGIVISNLWNISSGIGILHSLINILIINAKTRHTSGIGHTLFTVFLRRIRPGTICSLLACSVNPGNFRACLQYDTAHQTQYNRCFFPPTTHLSHSFPTSDPLHGHKALRYPGHYGLPEVWIFHRLSSP